MKAQYLIFVFAIAILVTGGFIFLLAMGPAGIIAAIIVSAIVVNIVKFLPEVESGKEYKKMLLIGPIFIGALLTTAECRIYRSREKFKEEEDIIIFS